MSDMCASGAHPGAQDRVGARGGCVGTEHPALCARCHQVRTPHRGNRGSGRRSARGTLVRRSPSPRCRASVVAFALARRPARAGDPALLRARAA
jgi:hypothetical protein